MLGVAPLGLRLDLFGLGGVHVVALWAHVSQLHAQILLSFKLFLPLVLLQIQYLLAIIEDCLQ